MYQRARGIWELAMELSDLIAPEWNHHKRVERSPRSRASTTPRRYDWLAQRVAERVEESTVNYEEYASLFVSAWAQYSSVAPRTNLRPRRNGRGGNALLR